MANSDLLKLSDSLEEMRRQIAVDAHDGRFLTQADIAALCDELTMMRNRARRLENECSRHRWNEAAREEAIARETVERLAVMRELKRPDSNLRLFPVNERPFHDGGAA